MYMSTIFSDIEYELAKARLKHSPMQSRHEGYAVLLEEVDELWDAIKQDAPTKDVREEAIQVAAMAIALISETLDNDEDEI